MRPRTLLSLFVVVLGLLAFIWFYERDLPSSDERREAEKKVVQLDSDEVQELVLERGDQVVRLRRVEPPKGEGDGESSDLLEESFWRLVEPFDFRADQDGVSRLLETLTGLERERSLDDFDPAAVGLAEPRGRIRWVTGSGGGALLIGSEVPASTELIVQAEGSDEAAVVRREVWSALDKAGGEWRSRQVFTGSERDVIEVSVTRGGDRLALERRAGDFWVVDPVDDLARAQRVTAFLNTLLGLEAERFIDGPLSEADLGLAPPEAVIEIVLRGDLPSQRVELGAVLVEAPADSDSGAVEEASDEEPVARYARFDGQVVEIADDLEEALSWATGDWQADRWSSLDVWQVDRATVRFEGEETVLARDGGDWRRGDDKIGYEVVSDLLYAVDEAASEDLVPIESESWGEPLVEIELSGESVEEDLTVYPLREGSYPATVAGRDFALLLGTQAVDDLLSKLDAVRRAEPESEEVDSSPEPAEG